MRTSIFIQFFLFNKDELYLNFPDGFRNMRVCFFRET